MLYVFHTELFLGEKTTVCLTSAIGGGTLHMNYITLNATWKLNITESFTLQKIYFFLILQIMSGLSLLKKDVIKQLKGLWNRGKVIDVKIV